MFLTGNEDLHLKNFSVIVRGPRVQLAPGYDLLNTTIALPRAEEELALPLRGKRRLSREDFLDYYGRERLGLQPAAMEAVIAELREASRGWEALVEESFLPPALKAAYVSVLRERRARLGLQ